MRKTFANIGLAFPISIKKVFNVEHKKKQPPMLQKHEKLKNSDEEIIKSLKKIVKFIKILWYQKVSVMCLKKIQGFSL